MCKRSSLRIATCFVASLVVTACTTESMQDLTSYVSEMNARPGPPVEVMDLNLRFERYAFQGEGRDPFAPLENPDTLDPPEAPPPRVANEELEQLSSGRSSSQHGTSWRS